MLEPSKPIPSSNNSAVSSPPGIEKCCHNPGTSTNLKSTISTLFFFTKSNASLTAIELLLSFHYEYYFQPKIFVIIFFHRQPARGADRLLVCALVVLAQVQAHPFLFIRHPESHNGLDNG